jgi:hypothetical protein
LKELAWLLPFDERNVRARGAQLRRRVLMALAPNGVRLIPRIICLPTASVLPIDNGDFDTSLFFLAALGQMDVR